MKKFCTVSLFMLLMSAGWHTAQAELMQQPMTGNITGPTLMLLTMQRDHRAFLDAYDDYTDLDGDGFIDSKYKPEMNFVAGLDAKGKKIMKPLDYYGNFDSYLCYQYGTKFGKAMFYPVKRTRSPGKKCSTSDGVQSSSWSGDFLNYLTTTRLDAVRKVLYGGKRLIDSPYAPDNNNYGQTVIERVNLPDDLHAFGKEYTSIAVDGYDIRDYAPLPLPNPDEMVDDIGRGVNSDGWIGNPPNFGAYAKSIRVRHRHLFANMSLLNRFLYGVGNGQDGIIAPPGSTPEFYDSRNVPSFMVLRNVRMRFDGSGLYDATLASSKNIYQRYQGRIWEWVAGDHFRANNNLVASPQFYYEPIDKWYNPLTRFRFNSAIGSGRLVPPNPYGGWRGDVVDRSKDLYDVRVQVCMPEFLPKVDGPDAGYCKAYNNGTHYKPVGVLHEFGENNQVYFGLLTGSYANSMDGGVLRRNIASFRDEVNAGSGQFNAGVKGIVNTLDRLAIAGYDYRADVTQESNMISSVNINLGDASWHRPRGEVKKYTDDNWWGNPIGEMMYEGYRYFAGKSTASKEFSSGGTNPDYDTALGLTKITDWTGDKKAFYHGNQCSRPIQMVFGDITPTFDSDKVPGSKFSSFSGDVSGMNAADSADAIWNAEGLGGRSIFIGEKKSAPEANLPTAKAGVSGFSEIRGLTPEDPTLQGSYYSAGVAKFAKETDLSKFNAAVAPRTTVQTLAVALSGGVPKIQFPVDYGGKRTMVTVVPFAKHDTQNAASYATSSDWGEVDRPARIFVENMVNVPGAPSDPATNGGQPYYKFRVIFDEGEFASNPNGFVRHPGSDSGNTANNRDVDAVYEIAANNSTGKVTINICSSPDPSYLPASAPRCDMDGVPSNGKAYSLWLNHLGYVVDGVKITSGKNARFVVRTNESRVLNFIVDKPHILDVDANKVSSNFADVFVQAVGGVNSSKDYYAGGILGYPKSFRFNGGETFDVDTTGVNSGGSFVPHDPLWYAAKYGGYKDKNKSLSLDVASDEIYGPDGVTPRTYFRVTNPALLRTSITTAIRNEVLPQGTEAAVAADPKELKDGLRIYQTKYNAEYWSGQFGAKDIDPLTYAESWTPKDTIKAPDVRPVYTYRYSANAPEGMAFDWNSFDATERQTFFANREELVQYLRGDRTLESDATGGLRKRDALTVLGDLINSAPVLSSVLSQGFNSLPASEGGGSYLNFLKDKATQPQLVYVGGNDGMLHGFNVQAKDANDGFEVIAYVPRYALQMTPSMTELTKQTYVHRYLVDGQIALSDFYDKPASKWRTALVGAQGAGGKSIFALDVARPNSFGAADVLWEFTHPELGHTLTTPVIARLPDGNWYALVANGFESLTCDNSQTPRYGVQNEVEPMPGQPKCAKVLNDGAGAAITARNAKLFIIKLTPKLDDGWTAGSDYHVIHATDVQTATKAPSTTASGPDNGSDNGLTGVAVAGTYAYAGDLQGNVWKFDLSAKALVKAGADGPVFVAIKDGKRQPISAAPAVTPYPNSTTDYCVNVGTGRYVYSGDMADQSIQSAYGVVDTLADTSGYSRADLQPQTIMAEGYFPATPPGPNAGRYYRTTTKTPVPAGKKGWYLDLQGTDGKPRGERVVDGLAVATASNPRWLLLNTETPVLFDCDARRYNRYFFMEACTGKRSEVFGLENGGGDPPPLAQDCVGAYCQCTGSSCQAEHTGPTPPGGECRDKGALTWVKDDCTQKVGLYYRACRSDSAAKGEIVQGPLSGVCAATKRRSWQQLR